MTTKKTVNMLKEVRKNTTDPKLKKELDAKIAALENNKTIEKPVYLGRGIFKNAQPIDNKKDYERPGGLD